MLGISRQGFYKYRDSLCRPWKYQRIANEILMILKEDEYNDMYGRRRILEALQLKRPTDTELPSERTIYRIMEALVISHEKRRKPNGITKADREARKSDDLLKRNFYSDRPFVKSVTDITEIKCKDAKLYVSAWFDCYNLEVLGLAMDTNTKKELCIKT